MGDEEAGDPVASIFAKVAWTLSNPETGATTQGMSDLEIDSWYGFSFERELADGGQPITIETENHILLEGNLADVSEVMTAGSFWDHNGSKMLLWADGPTRRFVYYEPRQGLLDVGVKRGTQLFYGQRNGFEYSGHAVVFSSSCWPTGYEVAGPVAESQHRVDLYGQVPRLDSACNVYDYRDDHLVFTYLD